MQTFSPITDAIRSIEQTINKDTTATRLQDTNSCVVKAIAVALHIDFITADLLCRKHFDRKFRKGCTTYTIRKNINALVNEYGSKVISYWNYTNYYEFGLKKYDVINESINYGFANLDLNYYRRKNLTIEQVRRQSKKRTFFVLIHRHALIIRDQQIIDYAEMKKRRVLHVFEIL